MGCVAIKLWESELSHIAMEEDRMTFDYDELLEVFSEDHYKTDWQDIMNRGWVWNILRYLKHIPFLNELIRSERIAGLKVDTIRRKIREVISDEMWTELIEDLKERQQSWKKSNKNVKKKDLQSVVDKWISNITLPDDYRTTAMYAIDTVIILHKQDGSTSVSYMIQEFTSSAVTHHYDVDDNGLWVERKNP